MSMILNIMIMDFKSCEWLHIDTNDYTRYG